MGKLLATVALVATPPESSDAVGVLGTLLAVAKTEKSSISTAPPSGLSSGSSSSKSSSDAVVNNGNKVSVALHGAGRWGLVHIDHCDF